MWPSNMILFNIKYRYWLLYSRKSYIENSSSCLLVYICPYAHQYMYKALSCRASTHKSNICGPFNCIFTCVSWKVLAPSWFYLEISDNDSVQCCTRRRSHDMALLCMTHFWSGSSHLTLLVVSASPSTCQWFLEFMTCWQVGIFLMRYICF